MPRIQPYVSTAALPSVMPMRVRPPVSGAGGSLQDVGEQIMRLGEHINEVHQTTELTSAQISAENRLAELVAAFDQDPEGDAEQWSRDAAAIKTQIDKTLTSPRTKRAFDAYWTRLAGRQKIKVKGIEFGRVLDRARASTVEDLQGLLVRAGETETEEELTNIIGLGAGKIRAQQAAGAFTAEQATKLELKFLSDIEKIKIKKLIQQDPVTAMSMLLDDKNWKALTEEDRFSLYRTARSESDRIVRQQEKAEREAEKNLKARYEENIAIAMEEIRQGRLVSGVEINADIGNKWDGKGAQELLRYLDSTLSGEQARMRDDQAAVSEIADEFARLAMQDFVSAEEVNEFKRLVRQAGNDKNIKGDTVSKWLTRIDNIEADPARDAEYQRVEEFLEGLIYNAAEESPDFKISRKMELGRARLKLLRLVEGGMDMDAAAIAVGRPVLERLRKTELIDMQANWAKIPDLRPPVVDVSRLHRYTIDEIDEMILQTMQNKGKGLENQGDYINHLGQLERMKELAEKFSILEEFAADVKVKGGSRATTE